MWWNIRIYRILKNIWKAGCILRMQPIRSRCLPVWETDAYDNMIYGCGADTDLNKLLSYIKEHAVVYKNMTTDRPAQVIGLSTCADARTNGRVIVFGRLEKIS